MKNSSAIIVAILATVTTVITNLTEIKEGVEKLFGGVTPKLAIVQPRLDFSRPPFGFAIPGTGFPGVSSQPERPTDKNGITVIGLDELREGSADDHTKFAELNEFLQLFIRQQLVNEDRHGYIVINPVLTDSVAAGTLRVAIKKETTPSVENCTMKVNDPNGEVVTSFNSVELPDGIGTNYYEFGVAFEEKPIRGTAQWTTVLACVAAGAGPENLITVP
ncbi:hypothetical protein [Rhizobium sp. MHM7A]|uniref:hypothetical protein n=1 Tax=Rhizobium sp. MHM7A TaxID=2583233 RepID=UPI00110575DC|nr:hypothetical protein [Rhizobium sp. MHM7A]TLX15775.1 hypothetical protein FFR93_00215 [Rhizobium sp. MHM7A]